MANIYDDPAPPILPSAHDVIGAGKARLIEVRPSTEQHVESGNYGLIFEGLRGQFDLARDRLAKEVRAARLPTAEGDDLTELCASNYDYQRAAEQQTTAYGGVTLARVVIHWFPLTALRVVAADATNPATLEALLTNIQDVFNEHATSVFDAQVGTGAHRIAETQTLDVPDTTNMGAIVATLNIYKLKISGHFGRAASLLGAVIDAPQPHAAKDTLNVITIPDAFASDPGASFSANSLAAQQSALILAIAIKKAINAHLSLRALPGVVREGTRWRVEANPIAVPPIEGGEYIATQNTYVKCGAQIVIVPARAAVPGASGNTPVFIKPPQTRVIKMLASLFDAKETFRLTPFDVVAAGGGNGQSDEVLRLAAAANWFGQFGPTDKALVAGSLSWPGVKRCPILKSVNTATSVIYAVDVSWAQSTQWFDGLEAMLRHDWLGVGCRIARGTLVNRVVRVQLTVKLRDRAFLDNVSPITDELVLVLRSYFDERPDFWIFRVAAIRAWCSRAHEHIFSCTEAVVRDINGEPIDDPPQPEPGAPITHWWFADGAADITYTAL